jgi:hypothetical protein
MWHCRKLINVTPLERSVGLRRKPQSTFLYECESLASFKHAHLGSFFFDPEDIKKLRIGVIWNFAEKQGCFNLVIDNGAQGASFKA